MPPVASTSAEEAIRTADKLSAEYGLALRECRLLSEIMLSEINGLLDLCQELGDERLHQAVRDRISTLPARMKFATCTGPSAAQH